MSTGSAMDVALLEQLSTLTDGELDAAGAASACAAWRSQAGARASWHAYQLIGDVLRSEDLAADPARDAAFIGSLRERLAHEPIVLAPHATSAGGGSARSPGPIGERAFRDRMWHWKASSAVAAGFVAVAGVFMLMRPTGPTLPAGASLARIEAPAADAGRPDALRRATLDEADSRPAAGSLRISNDRLIRDARLDSYLAAHKQFAGSSALSVPPTFLRNVTVESPAR